MEDNPELVLQLGADLRRRHFVTSFELLLNKAHHFWSEFRGTLRSRLFPKQPGGAFPLESILDGVWAPVPFTDPFTGNTLTLLHQVERGVIQKGNDPGNFPGAEGLDYEQSYHGVVLSFNKRFSDRWGLMASYTWSKSEGLIPRMLEQVQFNPFYGNNRGSDPNNYLNALGRLQGDRPHMFRTQAVFRLPGDIQIGAALNLETGKAHTRQIKTSADGQLLQGSKVVIMAPGGSFDEGVGRTRFGFPTSVIWTLWSAGISQ